MDKNSEAERLKSLYRYQIVNTLKEKEFDDLASLAANICKTPVALIGFIDKDTHWFKSAVGVTLEDSPRDISFCTHAIQQEDILIIPDALKDLRFSNNPLVTGAFGIRFYAGMPLITPDGNAIGTICVLDTAPNNLTTEQVFALKTISTQIMTLLELRLNNFTIKQTINELETARVKLSESEERFRILAETASDAIINIDEASNIVYLNKAAEKIFGYELTELLNEKITILMPENMKGLHLQSLGKYINTGKKSISWKAVEVPGKHKNGNIIPLEISFGEFIKNGKRFFTGIARDITERKITEEKLNKLNSELEKRVEARTEELELSQKRLLEAQQIAKVGNWEFDVLQNEITWTDQAYRNHGRSPETFKINLNSFEELLHPEDKEKYYALQKAAVINQEPFNFEYRVIFPNGEIHTINTIAEIIYDTDGNIVKLFGISQDITERKEIENRLRESEEKFRNSFEYSATGMSITNTDGRWISVNRAMIDILGFSEEELLQKKYQELTHPDDIKIDFEFANRLLSGEIKSFQREKRFIHKNGNVVWVLLNASLVNDKEGKSLYYLGQMQDITEKKKMEALFLRTQRMESIGTLTGGIAHDLNNILAPIMMSVQLLRMGLSENKRNEILTTLEKTTQRGADMVKQLLLFSRGIEGNKENIQLRPLIREMEKMIKDTFTKSITIENNIRESLWAISGDSTQLQQVFLNLFVNARDAMPDGGTLKISAENLLIDDNYVKMNPEAKKGPYVAIEITDTGEGIPPEIIDKIFEPFFTTKEVGKGTGLGLSTIIGIIKNHGGFISVYSEVGKGSQFKIFIPAIITEQAKFFESLELEFQKGNGELIMVVDDESSILDITRKTLEEYGYRVITAGNGLEAIEKYKENRNEIKVILTDINMPVMDGDTMIKTLFGINPEARFIASSGFSSFKTNSESLSLNVKSFLQKPYTTEKLLKEINEILSTTQPY